MLLSHIYISHIYLAAATYIITGPHTYTISRYIYYIIRIHIIHITMHADILSSISRHDSHVTSRATSLAPPMRLIVRHTHRLMSHFFGSTFHSFIVLSAIAQIYTYIDTVSHPLLFVLYYCTSIESTLVAYCISSTALHPLSLHYHLPVGYLLLVLAPIMNTQKSPSIDAVYG